MDGTGIRLSSPTINCPDAAAHGADPFCLSTWDLLEK